MDANPLPQTSTLRHTVAQNLPRSRPRLSQRAKQPGLAHAFAIAAVPSACLLRRKYAKRAVFSSARRARGPGSKRELPKDFPSGWEEVGNAEVFFPKTPKRFIHFLGGAFVGVSPRLFYENFLESLAESCEAIVIATPYQLSFDYDAMAQSSALSFKSTSSQLMSDYPACGDFPTSAVGHSCGALLHALLAVGGAGYQACVLMSFNNKPISDAIPVPLPDAPNDPRLRELARTNVEALLATENVEDSLRIARTALRNVGLDGSGSDAARKAAPVLSQFGPLLGSVVDGKKEFSMSREEIFERLSSTAFPGKTLVVQFANDFTDDSYELKSYIDGKEVKFLRFPGGHTSPLEASFGGRRQDRLSTKICSFLNGDDLAGSEQDEEEATSLLKNNFLRLSAGYNRGFSPLRNSERTEIIKCIEELEAKEDGSWRSGSDAGIDSLMTKLSGKWRLIWATSPDVLLLTSIPLAECGEICQEVQIEAKDRLKVVNSVELSPKGASLLGATLPDVVRALGVVSKVEATAVSSGARVFTLQLQEAKLEPLEPIIPGLLQLLPPVKLAATSSTKLLTTFVDSELRVARSPLGDVFVFSRL